MNSGYQTPPNRDVVGVDRQRGRQRVGTLSVRAYYVGHVQRQPSLRKRGALTGPTTDNVNPFRESYRERLRKLGGQYRPASLLDRCERAIAAEEPGVAMQRDLKLGTLPAVNPF